MLEKEIKILDIDQEKTIQILENLGAEKTFEWYIHDIYYDFEDWENQKMDQNKRNNLGTWSLIQMNLNSFKNNWLSLSNSWFQMKKLNDSYFKT